MMDIVDKLGRIASSLDEIEREDVLDGIAEITRLHAEVERLRDENKRLRYAFYDRPGTSGT